LPGPVETGEVRAATGVGVAGDRKVFQLDASVGGNLKPWFAMTFGGSYVAIDDPSFAPIDTGQGFWPWLRPTFFIGPVSISTPLSGFGLAGPESAIWYGIAGLDVGIANDHAGVHAGIRYDVAGSLGGSEFSSRQLVAGEHYDWDFGKTRIGLTLEGIFGEQHGEGYTPPFTGPEGAGRPFRNDETFYMVMMRLSVAWRFR
jgi:hypothetical protein